MAKRAFNFSKLDLAELVQLRDQIETALNGRIVIEREELQAKIAELETLQRKRSNSDRVVGLSKAGKRSTKTTTGRKAHALKGRKAEPKYRGPNGEIWAGRGLAPTWLTALEKKGKNRDQFLIKK